jgi:hypothetical protein
VRVLHALIWVRASALTRARILPSSNVIARHDALLAVRAGVHSVAPCVCGSFLCARSCTLTRDGFDGPLFTLLRTYEWTEQNDPVMGGRSSGNWSVVDDYGVFQGTTRIVPSLKGVCVCVWHCACAYACAFFFVCCCASVRTATALVGSGRNARKKSPFFFGAEKEDNPKKNVFVHSERCSGCSTCTEHASKPEVVSGAYTHKRHYKTRTRFSAWVLQLGDDERVQG